MPAALKQRIGQPAGGHARRYVDTRLRVLDGHRVADEVSAQSELLCQIGFDTPLAVEVQRAGGEFAAAIQLGCQGWILSMISTRILGGQIESTSVATRMVSVLADGRLVMTIADDEDTLGSSQSEVGVLHCSAGRIATDILGEHLAQIESVTMSTGHGPVSLDHSEWRDVVMYGDRCAAAIRHAARVQRWDITEAGFGRFFYPPQPVATEAEPQDAVGV